MRVLLLALAGVLAAAPPLPAQTPRGPWVPLGSRIDALTTWLMAEGAFEDLDPLTRPRRLGDIRAAVQTQDAAALGEQAQQALSDLTLELDAAADSTLVVAEAGYGAWRNGNRDSFRSTGASGSGPLGGIWVSLERGAFTAVLNPAIENRLIDDPEYRGEKDRFVAGRLQHAYITAGGTVGDVFLGRMARQWGPALFDGLQVSPSSYATDQLAGTLRVGRFALTTIAQRLDDYDTTLATPVSRYFLAHRLTVRAGRGIWLAFTETGVYGGPGRGFEPALHMPLAPALLAEVNDNKQVNLLWGAEVHARLSSAVQVQLHGVIDDIQVDDSTLRDQRPTSGGFTGVVRAALPWLPLHASVGYTRVLSLTYRNSFAPWDVYASRAVGLARNFADYDQALLRLDARAGSRLSASLEASYLRQGSGDFRLPFPSDTVLAQPGQGFLVSPVTRAAAVRVTAAFEPVDGLRMHGELGMDGNLLGPSRTIAAFSISARLDLLRGRLGGAWTAIEPD